MPVYQRTGSEPGTTVMTVQDLAALGFGETAYVKSVMVEGRPAYALHAANGVPIAAVSTRDLAFILARQNDLDPVSAH